MRTTRRAYEYKWMKKHSEKTRVERKTERRRSAVIDHARGAGIVGYISANMNWKQKPKWKHTVAEDIPRRLSKSPMIYEV